jgi:hypothetical protein
VNWAEIRRYRSTYGFSDYVTRELVHGQLVKDQQLLRPVTVPNLDPADGEVFALRGSDEPLPAM